MEHADELSLKIDMSRTALVSAGLACAAVVILTHVAEHWHILAGMGWGCPNSPGHYLDLSSALLAGVFLIAALVWRTKPR